MFAEKVVLLQQLSVNSRIILNQEDTTMARPIAETPILIGNDALRFEKAINEVQPLSHERIAAMDAQYQSFTSRVTINI